ncbi:DUF2922 domain-containing protein [Metabacillus sp. FJAT-53654]|uniref:DUF2922 domain-containing protein n=1 Tax=Metabacillus rhizosphaerae TaxID=3117747 RepID=A0ABZ2MWD0_9BACI
MSKTLELQFLNTAGKTVIISEDSPVEPGDQTALNAAMDQILAANIFISSDGEFVSKKGARVNGLNVTELFSTLPFSCPLRGLQTCTSNP